MRFLLLPLFAWSIAALPAVTNADVTIDLGGAIDDQGTGVGNTLHILGLQDTPNESGSVLRAVGGDVRSGDATLTHSNTISVMDLFSIGVQSTDNGFDLIFDINESIPNDDVTIDELTLFFTNSVGQALAGVDAMASFTTNLVLPQLHSGEGQDDYFFHVDFTTDQWLAFTSDPTNRIGMSGSILDTGNGAEIFSVAPRVAAVPEPSSLTLLLLAGVGTIGGMARRRRPKASDAC